MTATGQPVTGQDINMAARAARTALEVVLAEQGTAFPPLAVLNTLVAHGGAIDRAALIAQLAHGLDVSSQTVQTVLHGLETRGLVRASPEAQAAPHIERSIELTPEGQADQRRLTAITRELTTALYAGFDADELAVTRRVLVALTERAEARVAAAVS
jgi:DNA-binding MarR family transcriptional regulator